MKRIALALAFALMAGCRAYNQVPPATQHSVDLTWQAPSANTNWTGCTTTAPCVYAVYRCSLSSTACGDTTNVAWSEITTSATRVSGLNYVDTNVTGGAYWYVVKTFQGTSSSGPSNITNPIVPGVPTAPAINTTVASNEKPLIAVPEARQELAMVESVTLRARSR